MHFRKMMMECMRDYGSFLTVVLLGVDGIRNYQISCQFHLSDLAGTISDNRTNGLAS